MKIAIVCPYNLYSPGGVQTHIRDSAATLRNLGHDVTIIAPLSKNGTGSDPYTVLLGKSKKIIFNKTEFDISLIYGAEKRKLKDILRNENFEIIHYHTIWTPFLPLQILYASKSINIATFHDTPPDTWTGKIFKYIFYLVSLIIRNRLDEIIAVSDVPARHIANNPVKKIHIIPPCINLSCFSPDVKPIKRYHDNKINILFLGRMDERKGLFILLRAYQRLLNDKLNIRLLLAGQGVEYEKIRHFIQVNNISHVEMLGHILESEKPACYASCDIFCSPAPYGESFGIVLIEAMASGKPVVAAANAGYRKILSEMSDFCLAQPQDADSLYIKLKNLVKDKALQRRLGEWGAKEARKYDCKALMDRYLQIYQNALLLKS